MAFTLEWWQLIIGSILLPAAGYFAKEAQRLRDKREAQATNIHAEIRKLQDRGAELDRDLAAKATENALSRQQVDDYRRQIEVLAKSLDEAEKERDEARTSLATTIREKGILKTIVLLLRNDNQSLRQRLKDAGLPLPPELILPPEPAD